MEVEHSFTLTYHATPRRLLRCVFPPDKQCQSERLQLRDKSAPLSAVHDIEVLAYTVWVRFENAFNTRHMLEEAKRRAPTPLQQHQQEEGDDHNVHTVMLSRKTRMFRMAVRSAQQLEQQLDVMKQHLLPGTFDDDEEARICMDICSVVWQPRALDYDALRRALSMHQSDEEPLWSTRLSLNELVRLAGLDQRPRDHGFEFGPVGPDLDSFEDLGDTDDEDYTFDVYIALLPQRAILMGTETDRTLFMAAHCALHRIVSRCYSKES